jgi:hypothetical protein
MNPGSDAQVLYTELEFEHANFGWEIWVAEKHERITVVLLLWTHAIEDGSDRWGPHIIGTKEKEKGRE